MIVSRVKAGGAVQYAKRVRRATQTNTTKPSTAVAIICASASVMSTIEADKPRINWANTSINV
ncbi:MAG: hypothetical protein HONDAALG_03773 [Gammaproteobacteria bacterium]|nr:hypothetical protein [Gammaproteobacteria bacterium]